MRASRNGYLKVVRTLLESGADPDVTDKVSAVNDDFSDPYHLDDKYSRYRSIPICDVLVIDDVYVYLEVHHIIIIMIYDDFDCDKYGDDGDDDDDIGDDAF